MVNEMNNGMQKLGGGARSAVKIKSAQGSAANPSQVIQLGTSYRLFFPTFINEEGQPDIMTAVQPGRQLNKDLMGRGFVPLKEYEVSDSGKVVDTTGLAPYARIARVLHDADCKAEKAKAEQDAKLTAEQMGREVDVPGLKMALNQIELKYHGDRDAKPNIIYPEINPAIGGLRIEVATEVLVVPLTAEGKPEFSKVQAMALTLSNKKLSQLIALLDNKDYFDGSNNFLEVHFAYNGTSRKEAGTNASYQGCAESVSLKTKYPAEWESGKGFLERLPKSSDSIKSRNAMLSSSLTAKEVVALFNKYASKHEVSLLYLDPEDELVKACAKDLLDMDVVKATPKIQDKLIAIVNAEGKAEEEVAEGDGTSAAEINAKDLDALMGTASIRELDKAVSDLDAAVGAPSAIDEL